jgi:hypothetical protein
MRANAANVRRAGLLLRALAGGASWTVGTFVDVRQLAKDKGVVATDEELAEVEGYLLDQGWITVDKETRRAPGWFALTRHGIEECQRKLPAEPKVYNKPPE